MAKITSNEYVRVDWVPSAYMTPTEAKAPTAAILNGVNVVKLSPALAWQDFALGATDSDDVEDRGITDPGNVVSRGFANYEATLSFFRDADVSQTDATSDYVKAFQTFRTPRVSGYLVLRVAEKHWSEAYAPGDRVSVFRVISSNFVDDAEGDDSVKFTVNFLAQGALYPYTQVAGATFGATSAITGAAGDVGVIPVTVSGKPARGTTKYTSSDANVVTVSRNGVYTLVGTGTATITLEHPAVSSTDSITVTVS